MQGALVRRAYQDFVPFSRFTLDATCHELATRYSTLVVAAGLRECRYWLVFLPYLFLSALVALRHQPFGDEAQAWLLARDNTLLGIWKLEPYEATPGLWHLLLYFPAHLGMPYATMHVMHWLLNGLAVYIILKLMRGDFQLLAGTVFSYLIFYEYGIIARNYVLALLGLAILAAAWFRPWSNGKHWLYLGFFLTAGSSVFGLWLAVPIAVALLCKICREQGWRKAIVPFALLGVVGLLCSLPILPGVCTRWSGKPAAGRQLGNLIAMEHGPNTSQDPPALADAKQIATAQPGVTRERPGPAFATPTGGAAIVAASDVGPRPTSGGSVKPARRRCARDGLLLGFWPGRV